MFLTKYKYKCTDKIMYKGNFIKTKDCSKLN